MAFLPVNLVMIFFLAVFYFWGWEGELLRNMVSVISSVFMIPMWLFPLFIMTESANNVVLTSIKGWLPTFILSNFLFFTAVLMYWATVHTIANLELDMLAKIQKHRNVSRVLLVRQRRK